MKFTIFLLLFICLLTSCQKNNSQNTTILNAKKFLVSRQNHDGSWDPAKFEGTFDQLDGKIAMTALSAASLLAYSDSHSINCIKKAQQYLIALQKKDGSIGERNYANGIVFYFLANAIVKNQNIDQIVFQKLFQSILSKQSDIGAWDYNDANADRNDMSISAWVCLGMNAIRQKKEYGKAATISLQKINQMLNKDKHGAGDESTATQATGAYTYGEDPNSTSGKVMRSPGTTMQAIILFIKSTQLEFRQSNWVETAKKDQIKAFSGSAATNLYQRFFLLESTQNGVSFSAEWVIKTIRTLQKDQLPDGSWPLTSAPVQFGGKIMSTALGLLILQKTEQKN